MDTTTVLEIIKMLDRRINLQPHEFTTMSDSKWIEAFRDHLQAFIEAQLDAAEVQQSIGE